jgi:hypothetical protein
MTILVILVVIAVVGYLIFHNNVVADNRPRKGDLFACSTCGKSTKHDTRTINGYNRGVRESFRCWDCFKQHKDAQAARGANAGSGKGCLGMAVMFCVLGSAGVYSMVRFVA